MPKYTVDGSFFVQQLSGIQRYAREILAAMDPMLEPGELEVAVPPDCIVPEYRNIKVVTLPQSSGILGWQRVYGRYLAQSGRCWLGMCNIIPMFHRGNEGIAVVHDVCYKARPDFYTDLRGRTSAVWHCGHCQKGQKNRDGLGIFQKRDREILPCEPRKDHRGV